MRVVRFAVLLVALFILASMVSIPKAHAGCGFDTWNGSAGDGKWETASNWSGGLPVSGSFVLFPIDSFVVTISSTQSVCGFSLNKGDTLICTASCSLTVGPNAFDNAGTFTNFGTVTVSGTFSNDGIFTDRCHGTVNKAPTGLGTFTTDPSCPVVGGEVLSLDYGSLMFSAVPWILILATMAAAAAVILRQKFKLF